MAARINGDWKASEPCSSSQCTQFSCLQRFVSQYSWISGNIRTSEQQKVHVPWDHIPNNSQGGCLRTKWGERTTIGKNPVVFFKPTGSGRMRGGKCVGLLLRWNCIVKLSRKRDTPNGSHMIFGQCCFLCPSWLSATGGRKWGWFYRFYSGSFFGKLLPG